MPCGWKWGYQFSKLKDRLKKLPGVNPAKLDSLYYDIEINACDPHDNAFWVGWGITDFLKANKDFALNVIHLLHWTSVLWRLTIFLLLFIGTSTIWIKYFNFTKVW